MPSSHPSLLLLLSLLALSFAGNRRHLAAGDTTFIEKTCKATKYEDLCMASLKSDPASQGSDAKGLALIMIGVGVANSTATSAYLSSQISSPAAAPSAPAAAVKKALKDCADKYGYAAAALEAAAQDLAADGLDYAYMHVTAAADYPNSCHNGFRRNPKLAYPPELARREDALKRICDVVLGIIDNLGW